MGNIVKIIILSCGLKKKSKSRSMARHAFGHLQKLRVDVEFVNMQDYALPFCDAETETLHHPRVLNLKGKIQKADALIVATPVYNYSGNSMLKNVMELTGSAWQDKVVGFLCAAGGERSYMSILSMANNLMLDFRCLIVPRFVYATDKNFDTDLKLSADIDARIREQNEMVIKLTGALT